MSIIDGTEDPDILFGDVTDDVINGLGGDDTLDGGAGIDTINGGAGDDVINVSGGQTGLGEVIDGGDDTDTIIAAGSFSFYDTTLTSIERIEFFNDIGYSWLSFSGTQANGALNGIEFVGSIGADEVDIFMDADQTIDISSWTFSNWNAPVGANGDPTSDWVAIRGAAGGETVIGSTSGDSVYGDAGDDSIDGGGGDDYLQGDSVGWNGSIGTAGNDTLNGGDGDDYMRGGAGVDQYDGGDGFDRISFYLLQATQGVVANIVTQTIANDGFGNAETMVSVEALGSGTAFADHFTGDDNANFLLGDIGDTLLAAGGDDSFQLGGGPASLDGGDGNDTINGFEGSALVVDGNADGFADVIFASTGVDVRLWDNAIVNDGYGNSGLVVGVENVGGSDLSDRIEGDAVANRLSGFAGDDTLDGGQDNDTIQGGEGQDSIVGGDGDDSLIGGAGNDTLSGGDGFDRISFLSIGALGGVSVNLASQTVINDGFGSTDALSSIEWVEGSEFADNLAGSGNGEWFRVGLFDTVTAGGGDDTIIMDAPANFANGGSGNDSLIISSAETQFISLIDGTISSDSGFGTIAGIENVTGGAVDDYIVGDDLNNSLSGAAGIDTIEGRGGDDTIDGGDGDDSLTGDNWGPGGPTGNDEINGGAGADFVYGSGGDDVIDGGEGDDFLNGDSGANDATAGNDTLNGGDGDDYLRGGAGVDTYDGGDGVDRISFFLLRATQGVVANLVTQTITNDGFGNAETMTSIEGLGTGTAFADHFTGDDADNLLLADTGDTILGADGADTIQTGGAPGLVDGGDGVDIILFTGGTVIPDTNSDGLAESVNATAGVEIELWNNSINNDGFGNSGIIQNVENVQGTNFYDYIDGDDANNHFYGLGSGDDMFGVGGNDTLEGGEGDDFLFGDGASAYNGPMGDDSLVGGDGDDFLRGGGGTDTYEGGAGFDRISFHDWVATEGVIASLADGTITNDGFGNAETMSSIEGLGGGTVFADFFEGDDGNNLILGGGGDTLLGGDGDDSFQLQDAPATLDGGEGNDTLNGFDGTKLIPDTNADGRAELITTTTGVIVDLGAETISEDGFGGSGTIISVENLGGGAYNDQLSGTSEQNYIFGFEGDDLIEGRGGDDALEGGDGADTVNGGEGRDGVAGGNGDDVLTGGLGDDVLFGGTGADTLEGGEGDDRYFIDDANDFVNEQADEGTDWVFSTLSANTLGGTLENLALIGGGPATGTGNASENHILGSVFANTLSGGDGEDTIAGGLGADSILGGDDDDLLIGDSLGTTLTFGSGVIAKGADFGNVDFESALALDGFSLANDPNIANPTTIAHVTVNATTDNNVHVYSVTISNAGASLWLDIDSGANRLDTYIQVYNSDGQLMAYNDDSGVPDAGSLARLGDTVTADSVVSMPITDPGTYFIVVKTVSNGGPGLPAGSSYNLHVGVLGDFDPGYADTLDGGSGADTMSGGLGNDTYIVDDTADVINEFGVNVDSVFASADYTLGSLVENLTLTGSAGIGTGNTLNNVITGNASANTLNGGAGLDTLNGGDGADYLDGGADTDSMTGGDGDDTYVVDLTSDVVNETGTGNDTVRSSQTYTLGANLENLVITGGAGRTGTGNELANSITGNTGNNNLRGREANDTISGGDGLDTLDGGDNDDSLLGGNGDDSVVGGAGADYLDGGAGIDTMQGGDGDDTYVVDTADDVVTEAGTGADTVRSSQTYTLGANLENLVITGGAGRSGTGNTLDNTITGNSGNNNLRGQGGADTLFGGEGDDTMNGGEGADSLSGGLGSDTYIVDNLGDQVVEDAAAGNDIVQSAIDYTLTDNVESLFITSAAGRAGTGNSGNNSIIGGDGNDTLNGAGGTDTLIGGVGDDSYLIIAGDTVIEEEGAGTDSVSLAFGGYTLADNVENLTLTGALNVGATGNALANVIIGNTGHNSLSGGDGDDNINAGTGNDTIDGGAGADTMTGSSGNDTFIVDNTGDIVRETSANQGNDTVRSSQTYTLTQFVENLVITGGAGRTGIGNTLANTITGNGGANNLRGMDGDDTIIGGGGNDTIDGGVGSDDMSGNEGDDIYVVDDANDSVTEASGQGTDTVQSSIDYELGDNVEKLTLTGALGLAGTGNALANTITGNAGANVLDGGVGADTLIGGGGGDTYIVDNSSDVVTETSGGGVDLVQSSATFTLGIEVENLTLTGALNIHGTGNAAANVMIGNTGHNSLTGGDGNDNINGGTGNDTIDGGIGADTMTGSSGNDTFIVDNTGDIVRETSATQGNDTVRSSQTYTLTQYVENLILSGGANRNGSGNILDNQITGNGGNNSLQGREGDDTLVGGGGNDTLNGGPGIDVLTGGAGADAFLFNAPLAGNQTTITDFNVTDDTIQLDDAIFTTIGAPGALAAGAFHIGAAAADASDRIIYNSATGALFYDSNGNGAGGSVQIATLSTGLALTNADFLII